MSRKNRTKRSFTEQLKAILQIKIKVFANIFNKQKNKRKNIAKIFRAKSILIFISILTLLKQY